MPRKTNDTKQRLIETAITLIWESSYGAVSVDGICKAADIKKGSFYHFFPSKIDLAVAAMETAFAEFRPILDDIFSPLNPPIERFKDYADMGYKLQQEIAEQHGMVCGCPFVSLGSEMAPQDQTIRAKTDEIIELHKQYYETTLEDMVSANLLPSNTDIKAKANNIYAFIMGQLVMARIQNSLEPLKHDLKIGLFNMIGLSHSTLEPA